MKEKAPSKEQATKTIMAICKNDRAFAEQLYSELYIYLNYDESLIEVDRQPFEPVSEGHKKMSWSENFMHRVRQALHMKGIEVEFDTSEVIDIIKKSSTTYGLQTV